MYIHIGNWEPGPLKGFARKVSVFVSHASKSHCHFSPSFQRQQFSKEAFSQPTSCAILRPFPAFRKETGSGWDSPS